MKSLRPTVKAPFSGTGFSPAPRGRSIHSTITRLVKPRRTLAAAQPLGVVSRKAVCGRICYFPFRHCLGNHNRNSTLLREHPGPANEAPEEEWSISWMGCPFYSLPAIYSIQRPRAITDTQWDPYRVPEGNRDWRRGRTNGMIESERA